MALQRLMDKLNTGHEHAPTDPKPLPRIDTGVTVAGVDPRAENNGHISPPSPLPHISRRSLKRVKHRVVMDDTCPYCGGHDITLVTHKKVYKRSYGDWPFLYQCQGENCGAYVGLHPHTDLPLGTLADAATRDARKTGKSWFMRLLKRQHCDMNTAYRWLAAELNIREEQCHWSMFDVDLCARAEATCKATFESGKVIMPPRTKRR